MESKAKFIDGVQLTDEERQYMLPHFTMLIVGKPGSGKTTVIKQLLMNQRMYKGKFQEIYIVSPSFGKMGIKVKDANHTSSFKLDWIYSKIDEINRKQQFKTNYKLKTLHAETSAPLGTSHGQYLPQAHALHTNKFLTPEVLTVNRLLTMAGGPAPAFVTSQQSRELSRIAPQMRVEHMKKKQMGTEGKTKEQQQALELNRLVHDSISEKLQQLPEEEQRETHVDVVFVLDDVIGEIKKAEFDPRLAQLIMNRRNLITNGTISIIIVTQKYTLIPSRIRSNANWMILFKLNPADFEAVYRDVVTLPSKTWASILEYVFANDELLHKEEKGEATMQDKIAKKRFDNLGIFVESNTYFSNFKRIVINEQPLPLPPSKPQK